MGPTVASTQRTPLSASAPSPTIDPSDPAHWTISFDGVGPLTIDGSRSVEAQKVGSSYVRQPGDYCQYSKPTVFLSSRSPTLWLRSGPSGTTSDAILEIAVGLEPEGRDASIVSPRTAESIGIGSTETALKSAYPGMSYDPHPYFGATHYLVTDGVVLANGGQHYLLFVVTSGVVTGIVVQRDTQYLYRYCEDQG
jgi:hypothetical protein